MSRPLIKNYIELRERVIQRDEFSCRKCNELLTRSEINVHHIKRRADGGKDELDNLITLCVDCHLGIHRFYNPSEKYMGPTQKDLIDKIIEEETNSRLMSCTV